MVIWKSTKKIFGGAVSHSPRGGGQGLACEALRVVHQAVPIFTIPLSEGDEDCSTKVLSLCNERCDIGGD